MAIQIQSTIDYEQVCKELGVTMDVLLSLSKNPDVFNPKPKVLMDDLITEFSGPFESTCQNEKEK